MVQIRALVYAKLTFLVAGTTVDATIELFAKEVMYLLQNCLKIADADVELEASYNFLQLSLISDIVCIKMLGTEVIQNMYKASNGTGGKYLKKAKAGSAEAEFDQVSKDSSLSQSVESLLDSFRLEAFSKASQYGCFLPILSDYIPQVTFVPPFITMTYGTTGDC